jgi:hypothetical protein
MMLNPKDDYLEGGSPVHRLSYCAFLDILGFSARLSASYVDGKEDELLQRFHKIFDKRIKSLKSDVEESLLYFKSFSDNVLLAHPQFSDDLESEFGFILWSIQEYQYEMALQGFFIRGGLAIGKLFVDENSVYGEALLDAYALETSVAVNPVVVLSDDAMKLVDQHLGYYRGEFAPQVRSVLVNSGGRYFINYLAECILEGPEGEWLNIASLRKHKEQIENALDQYAEIPAVGAKFSWLAAYHNYFCDSVSSADDYTDSLKVSGNVAPVQFKTLIDA